MRYHYVFVVIFTFLFGINNLDFKPYTNKDVKIPAKKHIVPHVNTRQLHK